ncbi:MULTISPECIES: hypothetical protein [Chromohalobacter]|uniref:Lipoprotein n=1 Tax=Chromohalobacter israelensis (strain ATCC BAA-138 / DSM 3043 / CIP 106854 / NCIMB 13768 / 1H11) TaxID=290398 RepID=Q1QUK1_CHRI1|nr:MULTISPECIES: hypothetical protein [Chromohalobacter]ABE59857.1 hypothetical protein Csal_2510 [Chromohalobacter salexigens DSM 3043]MDO0947246.1 hypothetical protein [Chromohalobacter salexigens]NQY46591.1 hypothetical protein [Chromohalobacter sp.]NWO57548.1 hypothetical protein [Chromohalobacter salexigens]RXE48924.1 hypothetical protein B4O83_13475 [Chromohalobacter salexigens]
MSVRTWGVVLGAVLLGGCFEVNTSQAPIATTYPISEQQRMQAAHHWEVLAEHEARDILAKRDLWGKPLYVEAAEKETAFSRGFRSLLTSELVQQGAIVHTRPDASAHVSFDVQVVRHEDRGYVRPPQGALTALAAGIAVATIPFNHWTEPALGLIPAAALADTFSGSWTPTGPQEVIITTQVSQYDTLRYSSSNLYYINAGDSEHYGAAGEGERTNLPLSSEW